MSIPVLVDVNASVTSLPFRVPPPGPIVNVATKYVHAGLQCNRYMFDRNIIDNSSPG